jgi:hypothetical protein
MGTFPVSWETGTHLITNAGVPPAFSVVPFAPENRQPTTKTASGQIGSGMRS